MVVLIDTNILIDVLAKRKSFEREANEILKNCYEKKLFGFAAAHSFTNMFYILRKLYSTDEIKTLLLNLSKIINIVKVDEELILNSLSNSLFSDMEDCLQVECAKIVNASFIVTRNVSDFRNSSIKAIFPNELLAKV